MFKRLALTYIGLVTLALTSVLIILMPLFTLSETTNANNLIRELPDRVAQAGSYRFDAAVTQTLFPRATPDMIGRQEQRLALDATGAIQYPDRATFSLGIPNQSAGEMTIVRDGTRYVALRDGVVEPIDAATQVPLPTMDFLGYLDAAVDVQQAPVPSAEAAGTTYYTFRIDSTHLAEHLRENLAEHAMGALPVGARVAPPALFTEIEGHGEVWLDAQGLPTQQRLMLTLPRASEGYNAEIDLRITFRDFGSVNEILRPVQDADGNWSLETHIGGGTSAVSGTNWTAWRVLPQVWTSALAFLALLVTAAALITLLRSYYRTPRRVYPPVALILITILFATPLLQQFRTVAAASEITAATSAQQAEQALWEYTGVHPELRALAEQAPGVHPPTYQAASPSAQATIALCGDGEAEADTDGDGLTDLVESCIGTDPYALDTDTDALTDTLEIEGIDFAGRTWELDPFKADSNQDGLHDEHEWIAPIGTAPAWDVDNDQIPNPWDQDNDGDGVSDGYDISPYTSSDALDNFSLQTRLEDDFSGYQYIHVQVQPENLEQLHYANVPIDWPNNDSDGQIRDLDDSTDDLRLVPFLEISTSDVPDPETAARYGSLVVRDDQNRPTTLYAPLLTVSDNGSTTAFQTKVAYGSGDTQAIRWERVRLVWLVAGQIDSYRRCQQSSSYDRTCIAPQNELVQAYHAKLRVTGILVEKSGPYEVLLMGTPQRPDDDAILLQLVTTLSVAFLDAQRLVDQSNGRTSLEEWYQRLSQPNTPVEQRFGIAEPVETVYAAYPHQDAALAELGPRHIADFLNRPEYLNTQCHDSSGNEYPCASLVLATEEQTGLISLDEFAGPNADFAALSVNADADNVPVTTIRSTRLLPYAYRGGEWRGQDIGNLLDVLYQRYDTEQIASDIQDEYPGIDAITLRHLMTIMYVNWFAGRRQITAVNAVSIVALNPDAQVSRFVLRGSARAFGSVPEHTIKLFFNNAYVGSRVVNIDAEDGLVIVRNKKTAEIRTFKNKYGTLRTTNKHVELPNDTPGSPAPTQSLQAARLQLASASLIGIGRSALLLGSLALVGTEIAQAVCTRQGDTECQARARLASSISTIVAVSGGVLESTTAVITKATTYKGGVKAFVGSIRGGGLYPDKFLNQTGRVKAAYVVAITLQITAIWVAFSVTLATSDAGLVWRTALTAAIVSTAFTLVLFLLSLSSVIAPFVYLFQLIDVILYFATEGEIQLFNTAVQETTKFFNSEEIATLPEQIELLGSDSSVLVSPDDNPPGIIVGNTVAFTDTLSIRFNELIDAFLSNPGRAQSGASLRFRPPRSASDTSSVDTSFLVANEDCEGIRGEPDTFVCSSTASARFHLRQPGQNLQLAFFWEVSYRYAVQRQNGRFSKDVAVNTEYFSIEERIGGNDNNDARIAFTVDVLPNTVDSLHKWDVVRIADQDGDGLSNQEEQVLGTDADSYDTDGDGLSDGYEDQERTIRGLDPRKADTDGDGLHDGLELRNGTNAADADSDDDGLKDGEEVPHAGNNWDTGWNVRLPGGRIVRVTPDPLLADADSDNLTDAQERDNALSPYAANHTAALRLAAEPVSIRPSGDSALVLEPGDTVTINLELLSVGQSPVTDALTLCLPPVLTNISGGELTRTELAAEPDAEAYAPPDVQVEQNIVGCGTRYTWDFGSVQNGLSMVLQQGEIVAASFTATVTDPGTEEPNPGAIVASLPYEDKTLTREIPLAVDVDDPTVAFTAPINDTVLRGTSFVVGGEATDRSSWVEGVAVELPGSEPVTTDLVADQNRWAVNWELPADGNYTLAARAEDYFGRQSAPAQITVTVDNTPPTLSTTLADQVVLGAAGTADNTLLIAGSASDSLSGIARIQISIDGQPWQLIPLPNTFPLTHDWTYEWQPGTTDIQGERRIALRAFDRAGNQSAVVERTLLVDTLPPGNIVTSADYNEPEPLIVPAGPLAVSGVTNDRALAPLPPRPVALTGNSQRDALSAATVWLEFDSFAETQDVQITWLGDIDGDARGDLAVGMPTANNGAGRVAIVSGRYGDWPLPPLGEKLANYPGYAGIDGAKLGSHIASAGDVNADGYYDLLIGDPENERVFLVFGRAAQSGNNINLNSGRPGQWIELSTTAPGLEVGEWQAAAGDVNGDGIDDLLIGATGSTGQVYLLTGELGAWQNRSSIDLMTEAAALLPFDPQGAPLSGVGDVNGDTLADFVVADPNGSFGGGAGIYLFSGQAALTRGARIGLDPAQALHFAGATGTTLAALGNVNADTTADGFPLTDFVYGDANGNVQLVLGQQRPLDPTTGDWGDSRNLGSVPELPELGGFLAAPGDVTGDGVDDLLLGTTDNRAYLVAGIATTAGNIATDALTPETTLLGVADAASTPYSAGADLNCDTSADLLLIPEALHATAYAEPDLGYGTVPRPDLTDIPVADAATAPQTVATPPNGTATPETWIFVDDDYCANCGNDGYTWNSTAFASIQAAVDAATPGTQITVQPGVYAGFVLDGIDDIQIIGVHPDAVFIDGPSLQDSTHAIRLVNATGVTLADLTIRNAEVAIGLEQAGVEAYTTPDNIVTLQNLLLHGYTTHGIALDRLSNADVRSVTLAGENGSTALYIDPDTPDLQLFPTWEALRDTPANGTASSSLVSAGGTPYAVLNSSGEHRLYRYNSVMDSWTRRATTGIPVNETITNLATDGNGSLYTVHRDSPPATPAEVYAIEVDKLSGDVYAGGTFVDAVQEDGTLTTVNNIARWDVSEKHWYPLGGGVNGVVHAVARIDDDVYVAGNFSRAYTSEGNSIIANNVVRWDGTTWRPLRSGVRGGTVYALAVDGTDLYIGGDFTSPDRLLARWRHGAQNWGSVQAPRRPELPLAPNRPDVPRNPTVIRDLIVTDGEHGKALYAAADFSIINLRLEGQGAGQWHLDGLRALDGDFYAVERYLPGGWYYDMIGGGTFSRVNSNTRFYQVCIQGNCVWIPGEYRSAGASRVAVRGYASANPSWLPEHNIGLGSGTNGTVYDLLSRSYGSNDASIFIVGEFTQAGAKESPGIAMYHGVQPSNTYLPFGLSFTPAVGPGDGSRVRTVALDDHTQHLYIGGRFTELAHGGEQDFAANNIAVGSNLNSYRVPQQWDALGGGLVSEGHFLHQYNPVTNRWMRYQSFGDAAALVGDNGSYLYATERNTDKFYRYDITRASWEPLAELPTIAGTGNALAYVDGQIYMLAGGGDDNLYRYDPDTDTWSDAVGEFNGSGVIAAGAALVWDGNTYLYATSGGNGSGLARFQLVREEWTTLPDSDMTQFASGSSLVRIGEHLLALAGFGSRKVYRYGPVGLDVAPKLIFEDVAFVSRAADPAAWANLDPATLIDVGVKWGGTNTWVGDGGWTLAPPVDGVQLALRDADFRDPANGLYRVGQASQLRSGYHDANVSSVVYVAPDYAANASNDGLTWGVDAFGSVQAAINSGANQVFLHTGRYREPFFLVSGVQVVGASAESTIIAAPLTAPPAQLVTAEGAYAASLTRLTIDGAGTSAASTVADGAQQVILSRLIIRNSTTGVTLDGVDTRAELLHLTLVENGSGVIATRCAPVDVRNSAFVGHSNTSLQYTVQGCPENPGPQHQYNAYWPSDATITVDGIAGPPSGSGEFLDNPAFASPQTANYRPLPISPLIQAGAPGDPVPGNLEGPPDIGYFQSGRAALYVDDDFGAGQPNNGLTWNVDAFDTIQAALATAQSDVRALACAQPDPSGCDMLTVVVLPGTYRENVVVPSRVRLLGSGADQTIIDGGRNGSIVTLSGVQRSEVRGFTIRGAGSTNADAGIHVLDATHTVSLTHLLLDNNPTGIRFASGATGHVGFTTVVDSSERAVLATDEGSRAEVHNSIFVDNRRGLETRSQGTIRSASNLLYNNLRGDYSGAGALRGDDDIIGEDPQFRDATAGDYRLTLNSPAVDSAQLTQQSQAGGGARADRGYQELLIVPLTIVFGAIGNISCAAAIAGVGSTEVGIASTDSPVQPVNDTRPSIWEDAQLATPQDAGGNPAVASFWDATVNATTEGLYRLYTRSQDAAGNTNSDPDGYSGRFIVDNTAPTIDWVNEPPDTTTAAAVELAVEVQDEVTYGNQVLDGIETVYFELENAGRIEIYAAQRANSTWTPGVAHVYRGWVPLPAEPAIGLRAVAVDKAGNRATLSATSDVTGNDIATITAPADGSAFNMRKVQITGYVRFDNNTTTRSVQVRVGGAGGVVTNAVLATPGSRGSAWAAEVQLAPGTNTVEVAVSSRAAFVASDSIRIILDTEAPNISLNDVAPDEDLGPLVLILKGEISDTAPGVVAAADVSFDGGFTWQPATISGDTWTLRWNVPLNITQRYYPVKLRARDTAGNERIVDATLSLDTTPPEGLEPVTVRTPEGRIEEGTYLDRPTDLTMEWQVPSDDGGQVTTLAAFDQTVDTAPTQAVQGTSYTQTADQIGPWYGHVAAEDPTGNRLLLHTGPYYLENSTAPVCADRRQFIQVDGRLDRQAGEWRVTSELLDDDERSGTSQELYAAWDASDVYLGWHGAQWEIDGQLVVYFDIGTGGTTSLLDNRPGTLPFEANYAVVIDAANQAVLWAWNGGWHSATGLTWEAASDPVANGSELRLPFGALSATPLAGLFVVAYTETGQPWATFPTTNPLNPAAGWNDAYRWANLCNSTTPNNEQPRSKQVLLDVVPDRGPDGLYGPQNPLTYTIQLTNLEQGEVLQGLELDLAASGLTYNGVTGITCASCAAGAVAWTLPLPDLAPGQTISFAITAQIVADLQNLPTITSDVTLRYPPLGPSATVATRRVASPTDRLAPTIITEPVVALLPGMRTFSGRATDGSGSGVALIEIDVGDGRGWQPLAGTSAWTATIDVPHTTSFEVRLRAHDRVNNVSDVTSVTIIADDQAPTASFDLPPTVNSEAIILKGTAQDTFPVDGGVSSVEVQFDTDADLWQTVTLYSSGSTVTTWAHPLDLSDIDGETVRLRARATDRAGNTGVPTDQDWRSTLVDNVSPLITITNRLERIAFADYATAGAGSPVLVGTVSDGGSVEQLIVEVIAPDNTVRTDAATLEGQRWQYTPVFDQIGIYRLRATAVDALSNRGSTTLHTLTVADSNISGLTVHNDGPTLLGQVTTLNASIVAGTNTTFSWDLGNGTSATGPTVEYVYPAAGEYRATVTATNSTGSIQATTTVTVFAEQPESGPWVTYLPLLSVSRQITEQSASDADIAPSAPLLEPDKMTFAAEEPVVISFTITNNGSEPTRQGFWVDLFINPVYPPTPDQLPLRWDQTCTLEPCFGIAWLIDRPLAPGESVTLTSTPESYAAEHTRWPGWFAAGTTDLYIYIDAWNRGGDDIGPLELEAGNNRSKLDGLVVTSVSPSVQGIPGEAEPLQVLPLADELPSRRTPKVFALDGR